MSVFSKFYRHQFSDSVPFSLWFVFVSRVPLLSDPSPRNDQRPAGNLFANKDTSVASAIHSCSLSLVHHMMSLNIDMKIFRLVNCDGSPILVMNSWTLLMSCNVVNPGKYSTRIPSVPCRLCPKFCVVMDL